MFDNMGIAIVYARWPNRGHYTLLGVWEHGYTVNQPDWQLRVV